MAVATKRIVELPPRTEGVSLSLDDLLPAFITSENKTKKISISDIKNLIEFGGVGETHAPVEYLGELIYIVPDSAHGTTTAYIPSIEGQDFTLERGGQPLIPLKPDNSNEDEAEYEVLDAGGFELIQPGDELTKGERFKLTLYNRIGNGTTNQSAGSFIKGKKVVTTNVSIDPETEMNRVIQVRAGSSSVTVTLPSVGDTEENCFLVIETSISNNKVTTVATTGGQYIYMNGESKEELYLMPGEVCWLWRDNDGFYVINDFGEKYKAVGGPIATYKAGTNQLVCNGQTLIREEYPRLWEWVQTLGSSLVSEATWNTASTTIDGRTVLKPYRGCFSNGDGVTTFRIPDLMNTFLRGVKSETGSDPERLLNKPGGFQDNTNKKFWAGDISAPTILRVDGTNTETNTDSDNDPNIRDEVLIDKTAFSSESRPDNVGVLWVINC